MFIKKTTDSSHDDCDNGSFFKCSVVALQLSITCVELELTLIIVSFAA